VTNQVSSSQKQLNKLESQESKLESLKNQETELDQEAATVSEALPTTNDVGRLFIQLSDLANNAGGSISGVTGGTTVGTTSTTSPASTTATTSASVPGVEVLTYSMPISFSSYFNFKNFLTSASSALRLISVNNITVSASSTGEITAGLNLTTYMRSQ
jgi:Tfp pilus assembly protein PilO